MSCSYTEKDLLITLSRGITPLEKRNTCVLWKLPSGVMKYNKEYYRYESVDNICREAISDMVREQLTEIYNWISIARSFPEGNMTTYKLVTNIVHKYCVPSDHYIEKMLELLTQCCLPSNSTIIKDNDEETTTISVKGFYSYSIPAVSLIMFFLDRYTTFEDIIDNDEAVIEEILTKSEKLFDRNSATCRSQALGTAFFFSITKDITYNKSWRGILEFNGCASYILAEWQNLFRVPFLNFIDKYEVNTTLIRPHSVAGRQYGCALPLNVLVDWYKKEETQWH